MKYLILVTSLLFFGCSDPEVIYVDSNTGKPINRIKTETFEKKVVCNEFGMAYYENYPQGGKVYTPVIAPLANAFNEPISHMSKGTVHLTCEEYISLKKGN